MPAISGIFQWYLPAGQYLSQPWSDDLTLYIVHHTTIERYIAARIYSEEINIYGVKSVVRLLSVNCLHV